MKVKILKPIAERINGELKEFRIGEEITLEDERAKALAKAGLVQIIEKALDEPPEDKMIHKAKKK